MSVTNPPSSHSAPSVNVRSARARVLPKVCGGDAEMGNFITGMDPTHPQGTGYEASRLLLGEIDGVPGDRAEGRPTVSARVSTAASTARSGFDSQDWGRTFLFNGGCAYIDLNHLELCLPEVRSAFDHVAYTHALYRLAREAARAVNERLPDGQRIHVLANNSDGQANSYGSHLNVLFHRSSWEDLFYRRLLHQGFLASYQVSSIILTGQGKVGAENHAPAVDYQISQRADFVSMLCGPQTTYLRPILNSRNEALCGSWSGHARDPATADMSRLHVIFYDHNLCHVAGVLKVGVLQIMLAMMEAGAINVDLILDDPVRAVVAWSHDPLLRRRVRLMSGKEITAVELQWRFLEEARNFVATGACSDEIVPGVDDLLELWGSTLEHLQDGDWAALAPRLDWARKLSILHEALQARPNLDWTSPEIRHLDRLYSSLDPETGLFWAYEKRGMVERLVSDQQIDRCMREPPPDTRAWTRAALLLLAAPGETDEVDWDRIRFKLADERRRSISCYYTVDLSNPLRGTREEFAGRFPVSGGLRRTLAAVSAVKSELRPARTGASNVEGCHTADSRFPDWS